MEEFRLELDELVQEARVDEVKLTLKDGKEYTFSDVEIGYFRRFNEAAKRKEDNATQAAGLKIIVRSLEQLHPEATAEFVEDHLISFKSYGEVLNAALRASGAGELNPAAN